MIVDTPPTRNAFDFLDAPRTLARFLDHPVFKLHDDADPPRVAECSASRRNRCCASIGKVIGSEVLADALAFFQAFDGMETGFRNRADEVIELLHGERNALRAGRLAARRHDRGGPFFADRLRREGPRRWCDHRQPGDADFGEPTGKRPRRVADAALYDNQAQLHELAVGERSQIAPLRRGD